MKIKEALDDLIILDNKVGIRILPKEQPKYMTGYEMYSASIDYKGCEITKAYAKNDAIVFVVSHAEAVKHGLVKKD